MTQENIVLGAEVRFLEGLAEDLLEEINEFKKRAKSEQFEIPVGLDEKFLARAREALLNISSAFKKINKELSEKHKILVEVDDDAIAKFRTQTENIFKEALTRAKPQAKELGDEFAKSVRTALQSIKTATAAVTTDRSGGTGASTRTQPQVPAQITRDRTYSKKEFRQAATDLREGANQLSSDVDRITDELSRKLIGLRKIFIEQVPDTSADIRRGGVLFRNSLNSFVQVGIKSATKEIDVAIQNLLNRFEQLEGLRALRGSATGQQVGGGDDVEQQLAAAAERLARIKSGIITTNQLLIQSERNTQKTFDSSRQVALFAAQGYEALNNAQKSLGTTDLDIVSESFRGLGQVLAAQERRLLKFVDQLNAVEPELRELQRTLQQDIDATDPKDTQRLNTLKQIAGVVDGMTESVVRQRSEAAEQLELTRAQRVQQRQISDTLKEQRAVQGQQQKLAQDARIAAAKTREQVEQQVAALRSIAGNTNISLLRGEDASKAQEVLNALDRIQKKMPERLAALRRGLEYERAKLREEFQKGGGRFSGLDPKQKVSVGVRATIDLDRQEKEIEDFEKFVRGKFDDIEGLRLDVGKGVSDAEEVDKFEQKLKKAEVSAKEFENALELLRKEAGDLTVRQQIIAYEALENQFKDATRQGVSLESTLDRLRVEGKTVGDEYTRLAGKVDDFSAAMRRSRAASDIDSNVTELKKQANVIDFLDTEVDQLTGSLRSLQERFDQNTAALRRGGSATISAGEGFKNVRRELRQLEQTLIRQLQAYDEARRKSQQFSDAQQKAAASARQLLAGTQNLTNSLARVDGSLKNAVKGAKEAGNRWTLYNDSLVSSIKNNFRFINALTVVTSAIFLLRTALFEIIEESRAFSRTLTVLESNVVSLEVAFDQFKKAAREAAVEFGVQITEVAEVVKQFGSAGLTVEESLAGLDSALQLIISTSADAEQSARQLAGIYNVFGDQLTDSGEAAESFAKITDVLTSVYRNNQAELDELVQGLQFSAAAGKVAGFTFEEISGLLATLNDRLIKSGKAGRGLQVIFSQFAKKSEQFQDAFGIEIDRNSPLSEQFFDVMEKLNDQIGEGTISLEELGKQFDFAGLRGGRSFATLVQNVDAVRENIERLEGAQGTAAELAQLVKNELANSFERAKQTLLELVREAIDPMREGFILASKALVQLKEGLDAIGVLDSGFLAIAGGATLFLLTVQTVVAVIRILIAAFSSAKDGLATLTGGFLSTAGSATVATAATDGFVGAQSRVVVATKQSADSLEKTAIGFSKWTNAIAIAIALLPLVVTAVAAVTTTVEDARRALDEAEASLAALTKTEKTLKKFKKDFEEVSAAIRSGAKDSDAAVSELRRVVDETGRAFINVAEIATKSNQDIVDSYEAVGRSVRQQISLQEALAKAAREAARQQEATAAREQIRAKIQPSLRAGTIFEDDDAVDLKEKIDLVNDLTSAQKRLARGSEEALQIYRRAITSAPTGTNFKEGDTVFGGIAQTNLSVEAGLARARGDETRAAILEEAKQVQKAYQELYETDQVEAAKFLKRIEENTDNVEGVVTALASRQSGTLVTLAKDLNGLALKAFGGQLNAEEITKEIADILSSGWVGLSDVDATDAAKGLADFVENVVDESEASIQSKFVNVGELLRAEARALFRSLEADISQDTFERLLGIPEDADRRVQNFSKSIRAATKPLEEFIGVSASADNLFFDADFDLISRALETQVRRIPDEQLSKLADRAGLTLPFGASFAFTDDELEAQLDDIVNKKDSSLISVDTELLLTKEGRTKLKQQLKKANEDAFVESLASQAVVDGVGAFGEATSTATFDAQRLSGVLGEIGRLIEKNANVYENFENAAVSAFRDLQFIDAAGSLATAFTDALEDELRTKTLGNDLASSFAAVSFLRKQRKEITATAQGYKDLKERRAEALLLEVRQENPDFSDDQVKETAQTALFDDKEVKKYRGELERAAGIEAQMVNLSRDNRVEVTKRRNQYELLNKELADLLNFLEGDSAEQADSLKIQQQILRDKAEELRIQRELGNTTRTVYLAAINEIKDGLNGIIEQQLEYRRTLEEESITRLSLIAQAEGLLDIENKRAGLQYEIQSVGLRLNRINRSLITIKKQEADRTITTAQAESRRLTQYEELVDAAADFFKIEKDLEEKIKENNNLLDRRESILKRIKGVFDEDAGGFEANLTTALQQLSEKDLLSFAATAERALGIPLSTILESVDAVIPKIVEGIRRGEIAYNIFSGVAGESARRLREVAEQAENVQVRLTEITERKVSQGFKQVREFLKADEFDKAAEAAARTESALGDLLEIDRPQALAQLEELLDLVDDINQGQLADERVLKWKLELINPDVFEILRKQLRELTDQQINIGVVADDQLKTIVSGGVIGDIRSNQQSLLRFEAQFQRFVEEFGQVVGLDAQTIESIKSGGERQGLKTGGFLPGYGGGDRIPAMLEAGEFVMPKESVSKFGVGFFEMLRKGNVPGFTDGGGFSFSEDEVKLTSSLAVVRPLLEQLAAASPTFNQIIAKALDQSDYEDIKFKTWYTEEEAEAALKNASAQYSTGKNTIFVKPSFFDKALEGGSGFDLDQQNQLVHELFHVVTRKQQLADLQALAGEDADFVKSLPREQQNARLYLKQFRESGSREEFIRKYIQEEINAFRVQERVELESQFFNANAHMQEKIGEFVDAKVAGYIDPYSLVQFNGKSAWQHYTEKGSALYDLLAEFSADPNVFYPGVGIARGLKTGGFLPGYGGGDRIPAMLEAGEFVMPKESVSTFGVGFFEMLRRGNVPGFQEGGGFGFAQDLAVDWGELAGEALGEKAVEVITAGGAVTQLASEIVKGIALSSGETANQDAAQVADVTQLASEIVKGIALLSRETANQGRPTQVADVTQLASEIVSGVSLIAQESAKSNAEQIEVIRQVASEIVKGVALSSGETANQGRPVQVADITQLASEIVNGVSLIAKESAKSNAEQIEVIRQVASEIVKGVALSSGETANQGPTQVADVTQLASEIVSGVSLIAGEAAQATAAATEAATSIANSVVANATGEPVPGFFGEQLEGFAQISTQFAKDIEREIRSIKEDIPSGPSGADASKAAKEEEIKQTEFDLALVGDDIFGRTFRDLVAEKGQEGFDQLFGTKEPFKKFAEGLKSVATPIVDFISQALNFDFVLEGARAIEAATENYRASIVEINQTFSSTFSDLETSLARNETDFLSYIDRVQSAERDYAQQRIEASRALREELKEVEKQFKTALGGKVQQSVKFLGDGLSKIAPSFESFRESLVSAAGNAKVARDKNQSEFTRSVAKNRRNQDVAAAVAKGVGGALAGFGSVLLKGLSGLLSAAFNPEQLVDLLGNIQNVLGNLAGNMDEIIDAVDEFLRGFAEALPDILAALIEALPDLIVGLTETLADVLPDIIQTISEALPKLVKALVPALADLIVVIAENIPELVEALVRVLPTLWVEIVKALPRIILALGKALVESLWAVVTGIVRGIGDVLGDLPKNIIKGLGKLFGNLLNSLINLFRPNASEEERAARDRIRDRKKGIFALQRTKIQGYILPASLSDEDRRDLEAANLKFAAGGMVPGTGSGDIIPAWLEPGEYVIPKGVVDRFGPEFFEQIRNFNKLPRFKDGGIVGGSKATQMARIGGNVNNVDNRTNVNLNATVAVSGTSSKAEKRRAAREMVEALDEELANLKRNRKSKFDKVR